MNLQFFIVILQDLGDGQLGIAEEHDDNDVFGPHVDDDDDRGDHHTMIMIMMIIVTATLVMLIFISIGMISRWSESAIEA